MFPRTHQLARNPGPRPQRCDCVRSGSEPHHSANGATRRTHQVSNRRAFLGHFGGLQPRVDTVIRWLCKRPADGSASRSAVGDETAHLALAASHAWITIGQGANRYPIVPEKLRAGRHAGARPTHGHSCRSSSRPFLHR